jgi:hypothetical protein
MTFDPIQEKRNQKYTLKELDGVFKGSGKKLQEFKEQNPTLYAQYRRDYEAMGGIGKNLSPNPQPYVKNYAPAPKQYSADELVARGRYSEAEIRAFFNSKAANDTFTTDRNLYELKREAAVSYGLFEPHEIPYVPTKPAEPEYLHRVSDELADESNIARGTTLPWAQVEQLVQQKVQRAKDKQAAADAKLAGERQAELEKLTAAQKLEQAARDKKQADADRLAALLVPAQTPSPEDPALATARAIAAEKAKAAEVPIGQ